MGSKKNDTDLFTGCFVIFVAFLFIIGVSFVFSFCPWVTSFGLWAHVLIGGIVMANSHKNGLTKNDFDFRLIFLWPFKKFIIK